MAQHRAAVVYGSRILAYYAAQKDVTVDWKITEFPWTTRADAMLPPEAQYALVTELVYQYMAPDQPVRRIIADQWKMVWSYKSDRSWGLRLYERPQ